jgi:transposase
VRPRPEPILRFETPPGLQAQVDFAEVRLPWGKRYALMVVLGYSRLLWLQFVARQTMRALITGLEEAFAYFGGVPHELLFDQLKAVILEDRRPGGGRVLENPEFLRFAAHWGFRIRACRPYRAKTKGKVERPIRYVRQSSLYARAFAGDADLNAQVCHWLATVANVRVHATTHEQPCVRFERDERPQLSPLALRPYRSLLLPSPEPMPAGRLVVPAVVVEQRPLAAYARLDAVTP